MPEPRKQARCAIYTRKSTEHNLDLEFNSLDAQREACEAYIKSQAHEGWRLAPGQFDDGGISGGSLDRPALQRLISEIEADKVDIVVVYKVDRLTRSLTDFAKLVDLFDRHGVSFVSITQSFNTTTSMGRLTLNVLLSFAQFEREVIGERVRDKIAASKRKGLWMGGTVPLGYASVNKKLVIVEDEAETVRLIFQRYLQLGSIQALAEDLDNRAIVTKERTWSNDRTIGGVRFGTGPLAYLLKNRVYVGEVVHRNEVHPGDHQPILSRDLFDAVQAKLAANTIERALRLKNSPSLLTGLIYDERGNKMSPSHTNKSGARYRYYVSRGLRKGEIGGIKRVSAPDIESIVLATLRANSGVIDTDDDQAVIAQYLGKVVVRPNAVEVHLHNMVGEEGETQRCDPVILKWAPPPFVLEKGMQPGSGHQTPVDDESREALLTAIAKARVWLEEVLQGRIQTIAGLAERENKSERYIRMLMSLAFVSPPLVEAFIEGSVRPPTVSEFAQKMPILWELQMRAAQPSQ